jgi:hypothetical protein
MKIGQIPHIYLPYIGGIQNYVYRLKNSFEEKGHKVTIYTTDLSIQGTDKREKDVVSSKFTCYKGIKRKAKDNDCTWRKNRGERLHYMAA